MSNSERPHPKRRRRQALACEPCRIRKVRCDRLHPCTTCVRGHKAEQCVYQPDIRSIDPRPRPAETPSLNEFDTRAWEKSPHGHSIAPSVHGNSPHDAVSIPFYSTPDPGSGSVSTPAVSGLSQDTTPEAATVSILAARCRQLEQQLSAQKAGNTPKEGVHTPGTVPETADPGHLNKTVYLGQNHWLNGVILIPRLVHVLPQIERDPERSQIFKECKKIGRKIKSRRTPSTMATEHGKHIPPRDLADKLVDGYFRTFETVYRILHVPTFWQDYRRYWEKPQSASVVFVIQLQLVMAIGTAFYPHNNHQTGSLRHLSSQWVYEAQTWLMSPNEKSRMNIPGLQTLCLLHIAREVAAISGDLVWMSAGNLLRTAMHMGLHRDPSHLPKVSQFVAEMRRRLWVTVLEMAIQSSLDSGGPPMVSLSDFDAQPPGNFNDDQLTERGVDAAAAGATAAATAAVPHPLTKFTQTSVQITLYKSFPARLAVTRYVYDFRTVNSYDETLRLNADLTAACHSLAGMLQLYRPGDDGLGRYRPSAFQLAFVDHLTQRIFLTLHQIWLAASHSNPKYYFSRKVSVESALRLYRGWDPNTPAKATQHHHHNHHNPGADPSQQQAPPPSSSGGSMPEIDDLDDFARLIVSAAGGFRSVPLQCYGTLGVELIWQLEEEHTVRRSLGLQPGRGPSDTDGMSTASSLVMPGLVPQATLLDTLQQAQRFAELRILAGQTNIKEHLFISSLIAEAGALQRGASDQEVEKAVVDSIRGSGKRCLELLREVAARVVPVEDDGGAGAASSIGSSIPTPSVGAIDNSLMGGDFGQLDMNMPPIEWGWEELMQNQSFSFSLNFGGGDSLFTGF